MAANKNFCICFLDTNFMNSDWSLVESIIDDTVLCDYIALALAIITINFTAIWIGRKPKAQHIQSNPIDII